MKTKRTVQILVAALVLLASCSYFQPSTRPSPLTAEQSLLLKMEEFYLAQYNDYKMMTATQASIDAMTPEQKEIYKVKRNVLVQVEPMLRLYGQSVYGGVPNKALETQIIALLNTIGGKF